MSHTYMYVISWVVDLTITPPNFPRGPISIFFERDLTFFLFDLDTLSSLFFLALAETLKRIRAGIAGLEHFTKRKEKR